MNRCAGNHDGRGTAVVSDWHVQPTGRQGVFGPPEHRSDIRRMVPPGIKVRVLGDDKRQVEIDIRQRNHGPGDGRTIGFRSIGRQQFAEPRPKVLPGPGTARHEVVPRGFHQGVLRAGRRPDYLLFRQRGDVQDSIAYGNPESSPGSRRIPAGKHSVRKVVEREVRSFLVCAFDPGRFNHLAISMFSGLRDPQVIKDQGQVPAASIPDATGCPTLFNPRRHVVGAYLRPGVPSNFRSSPDQQSA